jgi:hypothetical protein
MNGRAAGLPSSYPENMIRWTAKFLLLVLLAPMAAAYSVAQQPSAMAMPADHCQRKAMAPPAMAGCHHHAAATSAEPSRTPLAVRANNCCDSHECCRSMVRTLSANVGPRPSFTAIAQTEDHVPTQHTSFLNRDLVGSHSVRGPPAL